MLRPAAPTGATTWRAGPRRHARLSGLEYVEAACYHGEVEDVGGLWGTLQARQGGWMKPTHGKFGGVVVVRRVKMDVAAYAAAIFCAMMRGVTTPMVGGGCTQFAHGDGKDGHAAANQLVAVKLLLLADNGGRGGYWWLRHWRLVGRQGCSGVRAMMVPGLQPARVVWILSPSPPSLVTVALRPSRP
ncbi:hypothetical protein DFJ73DRAFT_824323 [Zopfochytrium polystomum]|nr:hypothetical protein DFJ73DRAFT_824323 [Zopfochytrium polystomum]